MRNRLESKTGLIKSINAKSNDVVGPCVSSGMGQGLGNWGRSLRSLRAALGVSPKSRASPLSLSGTKICPARDSFQRPLAASPGSWLFLKRQAVVAEAIWKQQRCSGALMLQERVSARGCPRCGWGWLRAGTSPSKEEAHRHPAPLSPSLRPLAQSIAPSPGRFWRNWVESDAAAASWCRPRRRASLAPRPGLPKPQSPSRTARRGLHKLGKTKSGQRCRGPQQPSLLRVHTSTCPTPESSPDLRGLKEKFQSSGIL